MSKNLLSTAMLCAVCLFSSCSKNVPVAPAPKEAPAPSTTTIDEGIAVPESGFWERSGPGVWTYDLGVGLTSDIQLISKGEGRGTVRIHLPPGAASAKLMSLRVMYAKDGGDAVPGAASGTGVWHVYADEGGLPGAELGNMEVNVDDATAAPIDHGNQGSVHTPSAPIVLPALFWLVFEKTSGDPRVGAMRLGPSLQGTYTDLYFRPSADGPIGEPLNYRPYIAVEFTDLAR